MEEDMYTTWTKTIALVTMLCMLLSTNVMAGPGGKPKKMGFFAKVGKAIKKATHKAATAVKNAAKKTGEAIKTAAKKTSKSAETKVKATKTATAKKATTTAKSSSPVWPGTSPTSWMM